jgi:flagellar motor component MotA
MNHDEFVEQYTAFVKRTLGLAAKARKESLLGLSGDIDQKKVNKRDIFEYGLNFAVDGTDPAITEIILGNIIAQEKDEYTRLYKTIQKEAILGIQAGLTPQILYSILNSYTDLPLEDDTAYTAINNADTEPPNNGIIEENPQLADV